MNYKVIRLKSGMPTSITALENLLSEIVMTNASLLKVIHGYGSSGTGGSIKKLVHQELHELKKRKQISDFLPGEKLSLFEKRTQELLKDFPELAKDKDMNKCNLGITIIRI